jgi:hypothetical protein
MNLNQLIIEEFSIYSPAPAPAPAPTPAPKSNPASDLASDPISTSAKKLCNEETDETKYCTNGSTCTLNEKNNEECKKI